MNKKLKTILIATLLIAGTVAHAHQSHDHDHDAEPVSVRARDVASGIGYIVGAFGLFALWKSRKRSDDT